MSHLSQHIKSRLHRYFEMKLGAFDYRKGWMKSRCPYCGKDLKFGINLSLNRCNCFRCEEHPSPIDLVMYMEYVNTYQEVMAVLNQEEFGGFVFKEEEIELKGKKPIYLPEGFKLLNQGTSQLARSARSYIRKRGFDPEELSKAGWGYGTKDKYFGYLIIPFHENGQLVYFNARLFMGDGPRYNNPDTSESGIGKSFIIYNKDALYMYKSVFICEGAINAQTMGERGIASGGKAISRYQINEIIKSPVERITILFDSDAKEKAIDLGLKLVQYKKVRVVLFDDERDVNDLGKRETMKKIYRVHYQSYSELLKLKQEV